MKPLQFAIRVAIETAYAGLIAGIITLLLASETHAFSVVCGAMWMAVNFVALAWLLLANLTGNQAPRLFIFPIACAKLPASYFLLWWLIRADFLEPVGVAIGICILPPVLVFRGIIAARLYDIRQSSTEEGR